MEKAREWLLAKYRQEERNCRGPVPAVTHALDIAESRLWIINGLIDCCEAEATLDDAQAVRLWSEICSLASQMVKNISTVWAISPVGLPEVRALALAVGITTDPVAQASE